MTNTTATITTVKTTQAAAIAESLAYEAAMNAKAWYDRDMHYMLAEDGAILLVHPQTETPDGEPVDERVVRCVEPGSPSIKLGRTYRFSSRRESAAIAFRNALVFGL